jgi:hypothetical protein
MWRRYFDMAWCVVNDMLFIRMTFQSETPYFCVPVGPGDLRSALGELRNCCREQRQDLCLATVPDGARALIEEELANLTGKKFKTQRNHINKFKRSYTDYRFVRINAENIDQVRDFYKEYAPDNTPKGELPESESQAVSEFINEYYDRFNSIGYFLEIHGEVAGFAFGEIVNDTLFVHIEKASLNWHGSYQMLVNGFALELPSEIKYINREEDVGIEGLRQSKLSYNPIELLAKHTIRVKL